MSTPLSLSGARGCLFGQIAGDNLGALAEFLSAAKIAAAFPDGGPFELAHGGCWNILAGQPTDDSEMALGARARHGPRPWLDRGRRRPRLSRHGAIPARSTWVAPLAAGRRPTSDSQANGALMRSSPIGIAYAGQPPRAAELAADDAGLTHPNPACLAANAPLSRPRGRCRRR